MLSKDLKRIYEEYLPRYELQIKSFNPKELKRLILKASWEAENSYEKLAEPKTCDLDTYIGIYVEKTVDKNFASKTIREISLDNPPSPFRASANFFSTYPLELQDALMKKIYDAKPEDREKVWKDLKVPMKGIEKKFVKMIISRVRLARSKGYSDYVDMLLDKYKISNSDYKCFLGDINKAIEFCNLQLPGDDSFPDWFYSNYNLPCFICRLPEFPFTSFDDAIEFVAKEHRILSKFKNKINITLGNDSKMNYEKETDSFKITIERRENKRHRIVDLIHELSHVIDYLMCFKRGINPLERGGYIREREAARIEFALLKKISPDLYKASLAGVLLTLRRVLFEIELYKNPDQDLSKLYAETFNRCFKKAKQKSNPLYILDERIIARPFSTLPHAVASVNVLMKN